MVKKDLYHEYVNRSMLEHNGAGKTTVVFPAPLCPYIYMVVVFPAPLCPNNYLLTDI
jgi:hypothetical protein